jgi:hypothetical protein
MRAFDAISKKTATIETARVHPASPAHRSREIDPG